MSLLSLNGFPSLITERLLLREMRESDAESVYHIRSNKAINHYIKRKPYADLSEAIKFIKKIKSGFHDHENVFWLMFDPVTNKAIGSICLWNFSSDYSTAELGYELHPDYQGKGFMNEAMTCVIDFSFAKLDISSLEAFTHRENQASKNLLHKHGFVKDANRSDEDVPENEIYILSNS